MRLTNPPLISLTGLLVFLSSVAVQAQRFDEKFELWPVDLKIQGTVIAGGGGEMPPAAGEMFSSLLDTPETRGVILRFEGATDPTNSNWKPTSDSAAELNYLSIPTDQSELTTESINSLESANAVWVDLNHQPNKDQARCLTQALNACAKAVEKGGLICLNGDAAQWLGKFKSETIAALTGVRKVSNLIPDAIVLSQYDDDQQRSEMLSALAKNPRCVGIGIEEGTAIILRGRKIRVIGPGQVTFCLMANEHLPLRIQKVSEAKSRRANPYESIVDLTAWRRDAIERTVDPFPAAKPPTPNVDNGTLIIVGGGGMPKGLMQKMVELAGGENAKMVYVPCTEADQVRSPQRTVEAWKKMGVKSATFIHTKDRRKADSDEAILGPLRDATGIWFGGGRQWNFSDSYYGTEAHKLMKDVLARGGVIGGSSAGASVQGRYMCRANPVANFDIMAPGYERGLGFIGGVAIDQHFSQRGRQKDMTQLVDRYPQLLGIGLDEATAIIVQKSKAEVVGRGKVHFYDRNQPVVPGKDDFLALEEGSFFDLANRKIIDVKETEENDER